MKNLFISILAVSTLILSSCSNDLETIENAQTKQNINDNEQLSKKGNKPKLNKLIHETTFNGKKSKTVSEYKYRNDGLVKEISTKFFFNNKRTNKTQITFYKYKNKQITSEEKVTFINNKRQKSSSIIISYKYNKNGFLITNKNNRSDKTKYKYNKNGLLAKMSYFNSVGDGDFSIIYKYKGKTIRSTKENGGPDFTYTFDNKKNPLFDIFPKKYKLVFPLRYSRNNIKKFDINLNSPEVPYTKSKIFNTYYKNGYIKESITKEGGKVTDKSTYQYK